MQSALSNILLVVMLFSAIAVIGLVLIQQSNSGGMGGLGGGSSASLFGARGAGNFLTKLTTLFSAVFFVACIALAYLYTGAGQRLQGGESSVIDQIQGEDNTPVIDAPASLDGADTGEAQPENDVPLINDSGESLDSEGAAAVKATDRMIEEAESAVTEAIEDVEHTTVEAAQSVKESAVETSETIGDAVNNSQEAASESGNALSEEALRKAAEEELNK